MNLTLHLCGKDARRVWPWVTLQLVAMVCRYCWFVALQSTPEVPAPAETRSLFSGSDHLVCGLLMWLEHLAVVMGVLVLVQEDSLVSARAHWRTRPIAGIRLLACKTISILGYFGLLPLAIKGLWWLGNGFDYYDLVEVLLFFGATRILLVVLTWAIGTCASTLSGSLLGVAVATVLLTASFSFALSPMPGATNPSRDPAVGRMLLGAATAIGAAVAVILLQHTRAWTRRSRIVLFASGGAILLLSSSWPYSLLPKTAALHSKVTLASLRPAQSEWVIVARGSMDSHEVHREHSQATRVLRYSERQLQLLLRGPSRPMQRGRFANRVYLADEPAARDWRIQDHFADEIPEQTRSRLSVDGVELAHVRYRLTTAPAPGSYFIRATKLFRRSVSATPPRS